ncbi:hypothetical protein G6F43_006146 [Rhizopus delemar]|nr:hypothetical protein G6F43_006146 [Rhizopus delemar]
METVQNYNGGIVFVSYLISVIGAQTTLELLTKRTHIHGLYNWFLLTAAAFVMGAVTIWSMHFIGNNSLDLRINDKSYQLSYRVGYTFASLIVAIVCMFISFTFVGITEEVYLSRIIPSGVFTGLGIVCMHYVGQYAIECFTIVYKTGYIIGATVIACVAVTAALYIFFKVRGNWMNSWYRRLGCSMLMALAVCGKLEDALHCFGWHYFLFTYNDKHTSKTDAQHGSVDNVITNFKNNCKDDVKRLVLDCFMIDQNERILVKVDGTLPMKEVFHDLDSSELTAGFSLKHALFNRLFKITIHKITQPVFVSDQYSDASETLFDIIEQQFIRAVNDLQKELCFTHHSELGILSDIVITAQKSKKIQLKSIHAYSNSVNVTLLSKLKKWITSRKENDRQMILPSHISIDDSAGEDVHLFLVRQLTSDKDVTRLMSQGYRFAEPTFISKIMAAKLRIPVDRMHQCFLDMYQLTRPVYLPEKRLCAGTFILIQEDEDLCLLVDKVRRYTFPFVELDGMLDTTDIEMINTVLQGCTLQDMLTLQKDILPNQRLRVALHQAADKLISTLPALFQNTVLQPTFLDLPAFALTSCPCQLILFTALSSHPVPDTKYIPLSIYKSLCGHLTDQAVSRYRSEHRSVRPYSMQQQIYRQAFDTSLEEVTSIQEEMVSSTDDVFSLPPPPRTKRKRMSTTVLSSSSSIQSVTILPTKDRFWWIDTIVENIIHNSI